MPKKEMPLNLAGTRDENKKEGESMKEEYLLAPFPVNSSPHVCAYSHSPTRRRPAGFCEFSGEDLTACPCAFLEVAGC